jgi:hypothetical protein
MEQNHMHIKQTKEKKWGGIKITHLQKDPTNLGEYRFRMPVWIQDACITQLSLSKLTTFSLCLSLSSKISNFNCTIFCLKRF